MSLDRAISALDFLRPIAKLIPIAGVYLEGVVDLLQLGCKHAKVSFPYTCRLKSRQLSGQFFQEVKSNKTESIALVERAVLYMTIIVENIQALPESEIKARLTTVRELEE